MDNNWGNCMEMIIDDQYRWITTNSVPDYYFNPYCPIGRGYGYCVEQEVGKFINKMSVFFPPACNLRSLGRYYKLKNEFTLHARCSSL